MLPSSMIDRWPSCLWTLAPDTCRNPRRSGVLCEPTSIASCRQKPSTFVPRSRHGCFLASGSSTRPNARTIHDSTTVHALHVRIVPNERARFESSITRGTHVIDPNWFRTAPPFAPDLLSLKRALPKKLWVGNSRVVGDQRQYAYTLSCYKPKGRGGSLRVPDLYTKATPPTLHSSRANGWPNR